ncbi:MAG: heme ABC transporter ATP-binding protein/permease CydC [Aeromonas sp.]
MFKVLWPFARLYRQQWPRLMAGMLLALFTLLAGMGLLSLSGWFLSAAAVAGLGALSRSQFNYMTPAGGVRFLSIVRTAGRWGERVVSHDATFRLLTALRHWFWQRLAPLTAQNLRAFRQTDLLNRLVADIDALDHLYLRLLTPLWVALLGSGVLVGALALVDSRAALTLGAILLLAIGLLPWLFYRAGRRAGVALNVQKAALRTQLLDYVEGQAELQLFGAAKARFSEVDAAQTQLIDAQVRMARVSGAASAAMQLLSGWTVCLMLWLAGHGVSGQTPDALSALLVFATLASFEAILPLAGAFMHLSTTVSAASRLSEVLHTAKAPHWGTHSRPAQRGEVVLRQVSFSYPGGAPVLNACDLTLRAGEKLALLGQTGCGKSTLLGLLTRQWQLTQGEVLLDGVPLAAYSQAALRASITVVSQRVHLFSASLADNLRIAAPNATDAALSSALAQVGLSYLLTDDELGLAQWLGEGGRPLSGGERRRIGLARALLHNAPIWLLDEPTEGLDSQTEQAIMALLTNLGREKSVLLISHRLQGLAALDRLALMERGAIRLAGSHAELLNDDYYRGLYQRLAPSA